MNIHEHNLMIDWLVGCVQVCRSAVYHARIASHATKAKAGAKGAKAKVVKAKKAKKALPGISAMAAMENAQLRLKSIRAICSLCSCAIGWMKHQKAGTDMKDLVVPQHLKTV